MKRKLVQLNPEAIARAGASSVLALDASAVGSSASMLEEAPAPVRGRVDIVGPLAQKAVDGLCAYVDGYDSIAARFEKALAESDGVLLVIDSPGGDVAGLESGVARMLDAKAANPGKAVTAYVDELAASAAYWIAATIADHITVPPAGRVGSIGIVGMVVDSSAQLEREGIKVTVIREPAGKAESMSAAPVMELAEERQRENVKSAAERFYAAVGAARGLETKAVANLNGAVLRGQQAVDAKLADSVGSMVEAAAHLGTLAQKARAKREKDRDMKLQGIVAGLVGVSAESPAEVIEAAVTNVTANLLTATGASSLTDVSAKFDALKMERDAFKAKAEKLEALEASLAERTKADADAKIVATVEDAVKAGKVTPARKQDTIDKGRQHGQEWLDALIANLPVLVDVGRSEEIAALSGKPGDPGSTPIDRDLGALCKLLGLTEDDIRAAQKPSN